MTPAIKLLRQKKVLHEVMSYQHDSEVTDFGREAVEKLSLHVDEVFKTLVVDIGKRDFVVCVIGVGSRLCLKKVAKICGVKKAFMVEKKKVEKSTGYLLGGISPLGQKKRLKTLIDTSAKELHFMYVSGGKRGLDVKLKPEDLARVTDGVFCDLRVD